MVLALMRVEWRADWWRDACQGRDVDERDVRESSKEDFQKSKDFDNGSFHDCGGRGVFVPDDEDMPRMDI